MWWGILKVKRQGFKKSGKCQTVTGGDFESLFSLKEALYSKTAFDTFVCGDVFMLTAWIN